MKRSIMTVVAVAFLCGGWSFFSKEVKLAENGKPMAEIVLGKNPVTAAQFAAQELKVHLKAITGADYAIVEEGARNPKLYPIYVGATTAAVKEHEPAKFGEQDYVIDVDGDRTILFGRDNDATQKVTVVYLKNSVLPEKTYNVPDRWTSRGTLNAVYDFLRDRCGVKWLDCTEAGTIVPAKPTLAVAKGEVRGVPFTRCRDAAVDPDEWTSRRSPVEYDRYRSTAYPRTYAATQDERDRLQRINLIRTVFGLRMKLGGYKLHANHSFYWCYDRFWDKQNVNFIAYHPDWFSRHLKRDKQGRAVGDGIYSEVDTARRPAQMCYSNEEFLRQTITDIRAYFDAGGYTNRYTNQGVPCDAKHPVASWGKDVYCLEPMDNGSYCECPKCRAQYHPELDPSLSAERSDYWFTFVNKVAKEIKKSHPGKQISTLAYGGGREGLPSFPLEDNVVVHFCWDANRGPNREPLMTRQMNLMRQWRKAYPKNPFGVWLYNGFPHESGTWSHYLPIPGFFGKLFDRELKFMRDLDMRECTFHCGLKDDFELYLGSRLMWNPNENYETLKNDFFSSYGPAAPAVRKFYDLVEARYCNTNNYVDAQGKYHNGHMGRSIAWGLLIRDQEMRQLAAFMAEGEAAVRQGTAQERERFANWKAGYWDYIREAKMPHKFYPSPMPGVKIRCTDCYCTDECEFVDKDILSGKPFVIETGKGSTGRFWYAPKGDTPESFTAFTNPREFYRGFWNCGTPSNLVFKCNTKIARLKCFRLVTNDPARSRLFFNLVGWRGGEKVMIIEGVKIPDYYSGEGCRVFDFEFDPGAAPADLDAIGIEERYPEAKIYPPRYLRLRASDWGKGQERMTWFNDAKFGMFIHWGIYSVPAQGEWFLYKNKDITRDRYNKYANEFRQPASFSPEDWVKLAKKAGMRYVVLTTRHHDGFCLWDTKTTDFNSVKTAAKRDYVREFVNACRKHGLKIGFYYSIMNWQFDVEKNGLIVPDQWARQRECTHAALKELLTNYGRIDLLWYDGCSAPGCVDGEAMDRLWQTKQLNAMARQLQPWIVINDRSCQPEDYSTPEQSVTPPPRGRAWESCMTMNKSWGYKASDNNWKTVDTIWRSLLHCARFGGNYLLNVGPRADGSIPEESVKALEEIGARLRVAAPAIYGSVRDDYTEATHAAGVVTKTPTGYYFFRFNKAPLDGLTASEKLTNDLYAVQLAPEFLKRPCNLLGGRHDLAVKAGDSPVLGDNSAEEQPPYGELITDGRLSKLLVGQVGGGWRFPGVASYTFQAKAIKVPLTAEGKFILEIGFIPEQGYPSTIKVTVPAGTKGEYVWTVPEAGRIYAIRLTPAWTVVAPEQFQVAGVYSSPFFIKGTDESLREAFAMPWTKAKSDKFVAMPERNRLCDHSERRVNFAYCAPTAAAGIGLAKWTVEAAAAKTVMACLGTDWWADVYVNGVKMVPVKKLAKQPGDPEFTTHRPAVFKLPLKSGKNEVLVVNHGGTRANWLSLWTNL